MARVIQRVDGERVRQLRHDLLEQIELCAQGMQQEEGWTITGHDVAEPRATDRDGADRNLWRPAQGCGRLWDWSQRVDDVRDGPHPDADPTAQRQRQQRKYRGTHSLLL